MSPDLPFQVAFLQPLLFREFLAEDFDRVLELYAQVPSLPTAGSDIVIGKPQQSPG